MKHKFLLFLLVVSALFIPDKTYSQIKNALAPTKNNLCVVTKDNQTYIGIAPLPKITTKKIKMKTEDGQQVEINSEDIAYITAWHQKQSPENSWKLIYTPYKEYKSAKGEDGNMDMKITDKHRWMACVSNGNDISLYFEHMQYNLNKKGEISGKSTGSGMAPSTWYYVMREGEDMPTRIAYAGNDLSNSNSFFRAWGQKYFADCPDLVEQIKDKKMKTGDIVEVLNFYSTKCK